MPGSGLPWQLWIMSVWILTGPFLVAGLATGESLDHRHARLLTSMLDEDSPVAATQLAAWDSLPSDLPASDLLLEGSGERSMQMPC